MDNHRDYEEIGRRLLAELTHLQRELMTNVTDKPDVEGEVQLKLIAQFLKNEFDQSR